MREFLSTLFSNYESYAGNLKSFAKTNKKMNSYKKQLKINLNKSQKKLLLRFEDEKDLLIDIAREESFIAGFKLGVKVGYEVNKN